MAVKLVLTQQPHDMVHKIITYYLRRHSAVLALLLSGQQLDRIETPVVRCFFFMSSRVGPAKWVSRVRPSQAFTLGPYECNKFSVLTDKMTTNKKSSCGKIYRAKH
jgi:hypothetical protein